MKVILAIVIGALFAGGLYMMLRRNLVKILIGLLLLGHAVNLFVFTLGRLVRGIPPLIPNGETVLTPPYADPVPQALILTAIVISFGVTSFAVILLRQAYLNLGTEDLNQLRTTEMREEDPTVLEDSEPSK
ncbi:MAG: Na+/H+ antiporter subunit C [Anaerolineales bacterium]|nr:Na+/H+ antiporter subunit C [Anaerolineales bacterium]